MPNFTRVLAQLRSERDHTQQELQRLDQAIATLEGLNGGRSGIRGPGSRRRGRFSAAARARMAAAQRARRAKEKNSASARPKPRHMSAAARRKIAAAQRARWAKRKVQKATKNAA